MTNPTRPSAMAGSGGSRPVSSSRSRRFPAPQWATASATNTACFRQSFDEGRQSRPPKPGCNSATPGNSSGPETLYPIGFGGHVTEAEGRMIWTPAEAVLAEAYDTPVVGWQGPGGPTPCASGPRGRSIRWT